MDMLVLKKRIDGFRAANGQLQNVPDELLLELRQAWENYSGPADQFRRELGMKIGTLRKLLVESKKLNHVLASSEAMGLVQPTHEVPNPLTEGNHYAGGYIELVLSEGGKIVRFPNLDVLIDFLRKAS